LTACDGLIFQTGRKFFVVMLDCERQCSMLISDVPGLRCARWVNLNDQQAQNRHIIIQIYFF
jgi:hypothetical protein